VNPTGSLEGDLRKLPTWAFVTSVIVYLAIIQGVGLALTGVAELDDGKLITFEQVSVHLWIPLGLALLFVYGLVSVLGWWRPVMVDDRPVQRWVRVVPIAFILSIAFGINYPQLADNGFAFTIALLLATQFVGWGEEGMFRGISVTFLRQHGASEGKVALWSSVIFGAVHLTNAVGHGASAIPQAIMVSLAGYFFYLIRRVSGGNILNSVLHGLFDFALISGTGITVENKIYLGSLLPVLVYPVLAIVLLVRRHRIELPNADPIG
jgi:uncharacterized protein